MVAPIGHQPKPRPGFSAARPVLKPARWFERGKGQADRLPFGLSLERGLVILPWKQHALGAQMDEISLTIAALFQNDTLSLRRKAAFQIGAGLNEAATIFGADGAGQADERLILHGLQSGLPLADAAHHLIAEIAPLRRRLRCVIVHRACMARQSGK